MITLTIKNLNVNQGNEKILKNINYRDANKLSGGKMKIAIGVCEKINGICTTMGCFKALNNRSKNFRMYENESLELMSFFSCDACSKNSDKNLLNIAEKLEQAGVQKLHLGVCIVKCEAQRTKEIIEIFEKYHIEVVEGTH